MKTVHEKGADMSKRILASLFASCLALPLAAQASARPKAESLVKEGVAFLKAHGRDAFLKEVQMGSGRFHFRPDNPLYLFVYDTKGITLAHGATPGAVGANRWGMKDPDGKLFIQEIIRVAQQKGGGWVDYKFPNPATGKVENKTSFCLAEGGLVIGCGIYK